jgi:hypothetical protein
LPQNNNTLLAYYISSWQCPDNNWYFWHSMYREVHDMALCIKLYCHGFIHQFNCQVHETVLALNDTLLAWYT